MKVGFCISGDAPYRKIEADRGSGKWCFVEVVQFFCWSEERRLGVNGCLGALKGRPYKGEEKTPALPQRCWTTARLAAVGFFVGADGVAVVAFQAAEDDCGNDRHRA